MDVQVYRLLDRRYSLKLDTRMVLENHWGSARGQYYRVLPGGFVAAALRQSIAGIAWGPDGAYDFRCAPEWNVEMAARAAENLAKFSLAAAQGSCRSRNLRPIAATIDCAWP